MRDQGHNHGRVVPMLMILDNRVQTSAMVTRIKNISISTINL